MKTKTDAFDRQVQIAINAMTLTESNCRTHAQQWIDTTWHTPEFFRELCHQGDNIIHKIQNGLTVNKSERNVLHALALKQINIGTYGVAATALEYLYKTSVLSEEKDRYQSVLIYCLSFLEEYGKIIAINPYELFAWAYSNPESPLAFEAQLHHFHKCAKSHDRVVTFSWPKENVIYTDTDICVICMSNVVISDVEPRITDDKYVYLGNRRACEWRSTEKLACTVYSSATVIINQDPSNYYHRIIEFIGRLLWANEMGQIACNDPILVHESAFRAVQETINLLEINVRLREYSESILIQKCNIIDVSDAKVCKSLHDAYRNNTTTRKIFNKVV
jgi:hypothetical protein